MSSKNTKDDVNKRKKLGESTGGEPVNIPDGLKSSVPKSMGSGMTRDGTSEALGALSKQSDRYGGLSDEERKQAFNDDNKESVKNVATDAVKGAAVGAVKGAAVGGVAGAAAGAGTGAVAGAKKGSIDEASRRSGVSNTAINGALSASSGSLPSEGVPSADTTLSPVNTPPEDTPSVKPTSNAKPKTKLDTNDKDKDGSKVSDEDDYSDLKANLHEKSDDKDDDKDKDDPDSEDARDVDDSEDDDRDQPSIKDKGKNLKKNLMRAKAAADIGQTGMMAYQALQFIEWMKMMFFKAVAMVQNLVASFIGAIVNAVSTVATFLGTTVAMAAVIVTASTTSIVTVAVIAVVAVVGGIQQRNDQAMGDCVPSSVMVSKDTDDQQNGEQSALRQDAILKSWSVMHELGASDRFSAAVLGNWDIESGVDPTGVETIYTEPYVIGARKQAAQKANFDVMKIDSAYGNRFPAIKQVGIGFGQWTNGRNTMLLNYAKKTNSDWFDAGTQLAFMFTDDDPTRVAYMRRMMKDQSISIDDAVLSFLVDWEGNPGDKLAQRRQAAAAIYLNIGDMTVDKAYADGILSKINMDTAGDNNTVGNYNKDDGCGSTVSDHYNAKADGTGIFPADVVGRMWTPSTIPASVKAFVSDPESVGLKYNGSSADGWLEGSGQCVDFSNSYINKLYDNAGGITIGNGHATASKWAERYNGKVTKVPSKGAVFSQENHSGPWGHTGLVEHVFANGDILISEQNVRGMSGHDNGTPNTWNYRLITKAEYMQNQGLPPWDFFKIPMKSKLEK